MASPSLGLWITRRTLRREVPSSRADKYAGRRRHLALRGWGRERPSCPAGRRLSRGLYLSCIHCSQQLRTALNWILREEEALCDKLDGGIPGRRKNVGPGRQVRMCIVPLRAQGCRLAGLRCSRECLGHRVVCLCRRCSPGRVSGSSGSVGVRMCGLVRLAAAVGWPESAEMG